MYVLCWVHTKIIFKSYKIFKMWETTHEDKKILDWTVLLLQCVVCCNVTKTAHHTPTDFQPESRQSLLSAHFLIGYCFVSRDNLQIKRVFVLCVHHTQQDFWSYDSRSTFFRADSLILNTPYTSGKSDKINFRTTKIIGTLCRIIGRGEIGPKSARFLLVCTQH